MPDSQPVEEVGRDLLVKVLAKAAQESTLEMSITVTVGGAIVTGTLIGRDRWLEELDKATAAAGSELGAAIRVAFEADDLERAGRDVDYDFIHLMDAGYVSGTRFPTRDGVLWRGRISQVSSWSLGSF